MGLGSDENQEVVMLVIVHVLERLSQYVHKTNGQFLQHLI